MTGKTPSEVHFFVDIFNVKNILNSRKKHDSELNNNELPSIDEKIEENDRNKILEEWLIKRWRQKELLLKR